MAHDDLDKLLNERYEEPPRADLAEHIIGQAMSRPPMIERNMWQEMLYEFSTGFALPHPVLALSFVLFVGAILGMEAEGMASLAQEDLSSFLYIDEEWL